MDHPAATTTRCGRFRELIARAVDLRVETICGNTVLAYALRSGDMVNDPLLQTDALVRMVVEGGVSVDARDSDGMTELLRASWYGIVDRVALFLSLGADPNVTDAEGRTALDLAGQVSDESRRGEVLGLLRSAGQ